MKTALVTGATGFIGSRLVQELHENGYTVRAMRRKTPPTRAIETLPITWVEGDVTEIESLRQAMEGVDVVFHIAALYREAKFGDDMYWKVNFEGTRNALEAAREKGVSYFCHCSTTGVLGDIENPPADENEPYAPLDVYQESKTEAEKLVLEWFREGKIKGSVIRPTMVWGPGDTRLFKLFRGVARRMLPVVGDGSTWCHWVLVDDLVRGFRLAAETPASNGQLYIIGGERPVTLRHTMETIAKVYGVKLLPFRIPVLPIQLVGSFVETLCAPFGIEPPIHRRRADFFVKNRSFSIDKAKRELGYSAQYSFEEEAELVAKWYLDHDWITLPKAA